MHIDASAGGMYLCMCVYLYVRCACLAFAVLGMWLGQQQRLFLQIKAVQDSPGPVSVVEETELLPSCQVLSAGKPIPARAFAQQLFDWKYSRKGVGTGDGSQLQFYS